MAECDFIERCCFYRKVQGSPSRMWKSQVDSYCAGLLYQRCERRRFFLESGECAPAHVIPSGAVPEALLALK